MILIVGVTGVLGRETARQLLAGGYQVRGLTRIPHRAGDLTELGAEIVQGDLIDRASLERACQGAEAVLACGHLAEARPLFHRAAHVAEAEGDTMAFARAALGLGGEHPLTGSGSGDPHL